jgi:hypothetical protein
MPCAWGQPECTGGSPGRSARWSRGSRPRTFRPRAWRPISHTDCRNVGAPRTRLRAGLASCAVGAAAMSGVAPGRCDCRWRAAATFSCRGGPRSRRMSHGAGKSGDGEGSIQGPSPRGQGITRSKSRPQAKTVESEPVAPQDLTAGNPCRGTQPFGSLRSRGRTTGAPTPEPPRSSHTHWRTFDGRTRCER